MFKNKGKVLGVGREFREERGEFEKKYKRHKCHSKMNLCKKFHPNRTMGKNSKIEEMIFGKGGGGEFGGGEEF